MTQFLNHVSEMMTPHQQEIVWYHGEWQQSDKRLNAVTLAEDIPNIEQWQGDKTSTDYHRCLMSETDDRVTKLCTKVNHHRNLSVMYVVQNLLERTKSSGPSV